MKKNLFPFPEKVKFCAIILPRWWHLSFLLTFFSLFTLSAQKIHVDSLATANITVVGDACIYSKDEAFNEQISNNKNLQQYSKVIRFNDNEIRIIAQNPDGWVDLSGQDGNLGTLLNSQPTEVQVPETAGVKSIIGAATTPVNDGVLVLESATKAMVLPQVDDVNNIPSPSPGMMVFVRKEGSERLAVFNGTVWSFWKP